MKKKGLVKVDTAWAIRTNYIDIDGKGYNGFIGILWFRFQLSPPKYLDGQRIALFRTRKIAREFLPRVKDSFPNAEVVNVLITIKDIKND